MYLLYARLEFLSISCTYHFRALSHFVDKEVSCAFQRQMSHWSSELLWQTWRAFPCPSNTLALLHLGDIRRGCRISFCLWRLWIGRVQEEGSRVHVRGATKNDDHVADAGWSKEGYSTCGGNVSKMIDLGLSVHVDEPISNCTKREQERAREWWRWSEIQVWRVNGGKDKESKWFISMTDSRNIYIY